jgi:hypothetical protein
MEFYEVSTTYDVSVEDAFYGLVFQVKLQPTTFYVQSEVQLTQF